jgi:hypothetical protein
VQNVFDIHWQDEASRRHEVAYNILRLKFEEFYQNNNFSHVKNEVIFVQIYSDSTLQLVVHMGDVEQLVMRCLVHLTLMCTNPMCSR